jgi:predicted phosphodiesterase
LFDNHFGKKTKLPDGRGGYKISYDLNIAKKRMDACFDEMFKLCDSVGKDEVNEVNVFIGGDNCEGDGYIYSTQLEELEEKIYGQMIAYTDRILVNIERIQRFFNKKNLKINLYCVPGNHGENRFHGNAKNPIKDNYDTGTYMYLELILKGLQQRGAYTNVNISYPYETEALVCNVKGHDFYTTHILPENLMAYQANKKVNSWNLNFGGNIKVVLSGHYHTTCYVTQGKVAVIRVGCLDGPSNYSRNLGIIDGSPEQLTFLTTKTTPVLYFTPINLEHVNG